MQDVPNKSGYMYFYNQCSLEMWARNVTRALLVNSYLTLEFLYFNNNRIVFYNWEKLYKLYEKLTKDFPFSLIGLNFLRHNSLICHYEKKTDFLKFKWIFQVKG